MLPGRWKSKLLLVALLCGALGAAWWWRLHMHDAAADLSGHLARRGSGGPNWRVGATDETSIAGMITDLAQQPLAKVEVCAHVASYASSHFRAAVCAQSDAQGAYLLRPLEALSYTVSASAAGFVTSTAGSEAPLTLHAGEARAGVDLRLQAGDPNVRGVVVDATGGPVPNAHVRAERAQAPRLAVDAWSDDLGNFAFCVPDGPLLLKAAAPGYSSASEERVAPSADVRLMLVPGASLRGRVLSAESGSPLAGIELRAEPFGAQPAPLVERPRSDAQGAFIIDGLEPGSYTVTALGPGLRGQTAQPIELALGATVGGIEISVQDVAQVSGRVLSGEGRRCERGSLQLGAPDPLQPLPDSKDHIAAQLTVPTLASEIAADGAVHFSAVVPGRYYVTVRCHQQMLREGPRVLDVAGDDLAGLVWTVGPGASLRVLTVDERDRPLPGVEFILQLPTFGAYADHSLTARTDAAGLYDVEGILAPGAYQLVASSYYSAQPVKVQVRANEQNIAKLRLAGSGAIEATLRAGPEAVDGLSVTAVPLALAGDAPGAGELSPAVASALGAGRYRMSPLPAGRYEVRVEDGINPSVASGPVELAKGARAQVELALDRAGKIAGRVLDDRGAPVADAWVTTIADTLMATRGASLQRAAFATLLPARVLTDAQGEFSFERLAAAAGTYTVQVSVPGAGAAQARAVRPGNETLELVLRAVGSIAGSVEGVCGKGSGYTVAIQTQSLDTGQMLGPIALSPEGTFMVSGVAPGAVRITGYCEHPVGLVLGVATAELAPGQKLQGVSLALQLRGQGHGSDESDGKR